jgi:selenocysteine lyase/cysteine desulfurase
MSCGIGMLALNVVDAKKLVDNLKTKYNIYAALMPHEEYVGIRITPGIYTTVSEIDYFSETMERELKEA